MGDRRGVCGRDEAVRSTGSMGGRGDAPREEPLNLGLAIGLDTGGTGEDAALTAVILPERRFISVR